tara:strand:+ start:6406 stop:7224 length:819 start_codon:yes stop_codon:yes gene_type:complete
MVKEKVQSGLYIVATPIGNLDDMSSRAIKILKQADLIAVENTQIFRHLGIDVTTQKLLHVTEHNTPKQTPKILAMARKGIAALTSDAGTPTISDPGSRIVETAHLENIPVYVIPGPSALSASISISGFSGDTHFLGFLPRKTNDRKKLIQKAAQTAKILIVYENPSRLIRTLTEIANWLNDPETVVCRELTKLHEETIRNTASVLANQIKSPRGECTVVINSSDWPEKDHLEEASVYMQEMHRAGAKRAAAAAEAARRFSIERKLAYSLWPD